MELNKGFRRTDIGWIPEDWEVKKLGNCLSAQPNYGINAASVSYDDTLPTYLRITDISENGKYLRENKVSVNHPMSNFFFLEVGDIVFARTGASVGKSYLYQSTDGRLVFAGFLIRMKPNPEILIPSYFKFITQTKYYWSWVIANSMRSGQPGLNSIQYRNFEIPIPPLPEQTAIATALSDTDALLSSLDTLLTKKRNLKQAAMQWLLEPEEGWVVRKLGEIGECFIGLTYKPSDVVENGLLVLRSSNIGNNKVKYDDNVYVKVDVSEKLKVQHGDILICVRNGSRNLIGKCAYMSGNAVGQTFGAFMAMFRSPFNEYIFHVFQSSIIKKQIEENIGATINQITNKNLNSFEIPFPSKFEQTRIANILSDLDHEIEALEKKIVKYKAIKTGMMQNLLTGKIRLI
jgi:type I restriction enzyme S subunit